MPAQDDAREKRLIDLFNLERPLNRARHGVDALLKIDGHELEFELKSITITRGGLTTVRDFGRDHIEKWKNKHWLVAVYDGEDLKLCRYGSPDSMATWISEKWDYIQQDFALAMIAPAKLDLQDMYEVVGVKKFYTLEDAQRLHKKQMTTAKYRSLMDVDGGYSPDAMLKIFRDRLRYVIERGSTLNNPKVSPDYLSGWIAITADHASQLRLRVREWLATKL